MDKNAIVGKLVYNLKIESMLIYPRLRGIETNNKIMKSTGWVKCIAEIRNNETGEIREFETDEILVIGEKYPSTFIWENGNYACDCNRHLFFKRAKNEETEEDWDVECSHGNK